MKKNKFLPLFLIICLCLGCLAAPGALALDAPAVTSPNIVVMDKTTGEVLWTQNPDQRIYPASTTKIMTVLLAVEAIEAGQVALSDEITAGASMTYDLIPDGSSAGIVVGETMSLENFLYCAMVSSANESCNVIAEYIGGSIDNFIKMMNDRATELGCTGTHFTNTHGLPDDNHYSTASDMCLISMEAARHDLFMKICSTDTIDIPATNMSGIRTLNNSNALLSDKSIYGSGYVYEYASGIKTGHTDAAGYCLISTAEKDDVSLLAAVFGGQQAPDVGGNMVYTNFTDSITLYNWVFDNYSYQEVLKSAENVGKVHVEMGADMDNVNLRPESSVTALLPNDSTAEGFTTQLTIYSERDGVTLEAPISAGEVLGEISVLRDGAPYATVNLVAAASVDLSRMQYIKTSISDTLHSKTVIIIIVALVLLFGGYLALVINYRVKRRRHKKALQEARAQRVRTAPPAAPYAPPHAARRRRPEPDPNQATHVQPAVHEPPVQPKTPKIDYFSDITDELGDEPTAPDIDDISAPLPKPRQTPDLTSLFNSDDQAEIDYFEEFFKKK